MRAGQPTLYRAEYCDTVAKCGRQGMSIVEMACEIGVNVQTLDNWSKTHEEFLGAFTHAKQLSQAWWERTGRSGMLEKSIDGGIWSRSMAARFPRDWREVSRHEQTGMNGNPIKTENKVVWEIKRPDGNKAA